MTEWLTEVRLAKSRVARARAVQSVIHAKQVCGQARLLVRWARTFAHPRWRTLRRAPE
jgi:hypothetical protein